MPDQRRPSGFWARRRTALHLLAYLAALVFAAPRWPHLLGGLPLILVGLAVRTWALGYLVKDETLCIAGPYAYTRNPLYLGSLLLLAGLCVSAGNPWLTLAAFTLGLVVYVSTVRDEESFLAGRFGAAYAAYRARVPRLFPWPGRRADSPATACFSWRQAADNHAAELAGWVLLLVALLVAKSLLGPLWGWWPYAGG